MWSGSLRPLPAPGSDLRAVLRADLLRPLQDALFSLLHITLQYGKSTAKVHATGTSLCLGEIQPYEVRICLRRTPKFPILTLWIGRTLQYGKHSVQTRI